MSLGFPLATSSTLGDDVLAWVVLVLLTSLAGEDIAGVGGGSAIDRIDIVLVPDSLLTLGL